MTARKLFGVVVLNLLLLCVYQSIVMLNDHQSTIYELGLFWGLMAVYSIGLLFSQKAEPILQKPQAREFREAADPWELQRRLMKASGQELPDSPVVSNGSLLYAALNLEELAETFEAIIKTMSRHRNATPTAVQSEPAFIILLILSNMVAEMASSSTRIRQLLTEVELDLAMTSDEAVELLDGTTDLAVVNCGFALASGVPGSAAYSEVVYSNLSKVNPATGVIDKTKDGKWIKGKNYAEPDLTFVLNEDQAMKRAAHQSWE